MRDSKKIRRELIQLVLSLGGALVLSLTIVLYDTVLIFGKLSIDYRSAGSHGLRVCTAIINTQFAKEKHKLSLRSEMDHSQSS
jgi:hypothetical protein